MRRYGLVLGVAVLAVLLVGSLLVGLLLDPGRHVETWETALKRYLAFREADGGDPWQVAMREQATTPMRFDRTMSHTSYGSGVHFQVQVAYQSTPQTPVVTKETEPVTTTRLRGVGWLPLVGGHPLPYPPDDVVCVLLTQASGGTAHELLVFVAYHQDLYNGEWTVHEAGEEPFSGELQDGLRSIGCPGVEEMVGK